MKIIFCNIDNDISEYPEEGYHFSDVISSSNKIPEKGIAIISFDRDSIACIATYKKTGRVATKKDRIAFKNFVVLENEITIEDIEINLSSKIKKHFYRQATSHITVFSEKVCDGVLGYFSKKHPRIYDEIQLLDKRIQNYMPKYTKRVEEIIAQEKDAVNLVFKMFNFNESDIPIWSSNDNTAPFLKGFNNMTIREDPMVNHDSQVFGDWLKIKQHAQGIVEFVKENQKVTLMNVNRQPLEKTMGVDLLIYHHTFDSYTFIQYKRMTKESDIYLYRPSDSTYKSEIERMNSFMEKITPNVSNKDLKNYRFNDDLFYFKLCPARIENSFSNRMVGGMYLPLELWNILLEDDCTNGPKGGKQLNFNNVGRYFNNSQFINLAQNGWIGSKVEDSKNITDIIMDSINSDNSITLAEYKTDN
ncbi:hypothetical protein [Pseudofulvibacter geojedonensis]|uniref:Uncharacterized protein n=1 Tax=Pseudofulvibacter geojedonensis TaxID=1123758 RepID=A0ABW3I076_9FLAO